MRRNLRVTYAAMAWILVGAVVAQFFFAGIGIFAGAGFTLHALVGASIVFFLPLLMLPLGLVARLPRRLTLLTTSVPALVILQSLLLAPYRGVGDQSLRLFSALHPVNAILILWVAVTIVEKVRSLSAAEPGPVQPATGELPQA